MSKLDELAAEEAGETELPAPETAAPEAAEETAPAETEPERLYAGKYKTPEAMEEAYRNAEQELGRARNEIGQLRQAAPPPQQQPAQQQSEMLTKEQLDEWYDTDPVGASFYISRIAAAEVAAAQSRQLEPIIHSVHDQNARSVWNQLIDEFGADVCETHKEAIAARIQEDPNNYMDPQTQLTRLRETLGYQLYRTQATPKPAQPRDESGRYAEVHMEGGSTPAPPRNAETPEVDPIIQAMREAAPRSDIFGPVPD